MLLGEIVKLVKARVQRFKTATLSTVDGENKRGNRHWIYTIHCTLVYCVYSVYVLLSPLWCGLFSVQRAPVQVHQAMSCQPTHEGDFKRCQVKPQVACLMEKPTVHCTANGH